MRELKELSEFLYLLSARLDRLCFELSRVIKDQQGQENGHVRDVLSDVLSAAQEVQRCLENSILVARHQSSLAKLRKIRRDIDTLVVYLDLLDESIVLSNTTRDSQVAIKGLLVIAEDNFTTAKANFEKQGKFYEQKARYSEASIFNQGLKTAQMEEHAKVISPSNAYGFPDFENYVLKSIDGFSLESVHDSDQNSQLSTLVPVFFATDRVVEEDSRPPIKGFRNGRGREKLSLGIAEVSIPPCHRIGRLERPVMWKFQFTENIEKHVVITACEIKELASWKSIATDRIKNSGNKSALVYIHGYNTSFDDAIRRAAQIGLDLQFDGLVTAYSWGSEATLDGYFADEESIKLTSPLLLEFLKIVRSELGADTVHVIAHSMGNRALVDALSTLHSDGTVGMFLNEVIMAAPDIDADIFKAAVVGLKGKARRYTLYGSEKDEALMASKQLRKSYPRAGDGGNNVLVVNGIETIDASAVGGDLLGLGHAYFSSKRTLLSDLSYIIRKSAPPSDRHGLKAVMNGALTYWQFVP